MTARFNLDLLPASPDLSFETLLWQSGFTRVAGLDEAGRGAWAGPVAAAAVILPPSTAVQQTLSGVRDSKQMRPEQRSAWAAVIQSTALAWAVGLASNEEIDALGILPATHLAMRRALQGLSLAPDHLMIDYLRLPGISLSQTGLVKGDARCLSIAAASVLAKTARDTLLIDLDQRFPGYGFAAHKGYGTLRHRLALERLGPCPVHRKSFAPLRELSASRAA